MYEAADPGGRPRFGGAAGCTGSAPMCGFRRSTDTISSLSPTCSRNTFSPRSSTTYGPAYSGANGSWLPPLLTYTLVHAASTDGSLEWAGGRGLVGT